MLKYINMYICIKPDMWEKDGNWLRTQESRYHLGVHQFLSVTSVRSLNQSSIVEVPSICSKARPLNVKKLPILWLSVFIDKKYIHNDKCTHEFKKYFNMNFYVIKPKSIYINVWIENLNADEAQCLCDLKTRKYKIILSPTSFWFVVNIL